MACTAMGACRIIFRKFVIVNFCLKICQTKFSTLLRKCGCV